MANSNQGRYTAVFGAALPGVSFNKIAPAANVNCPAGSFTSLTAAQSISCSDPGTYLIFAIGVLYILTGAAAPTDVQFQLSSTPASNTDPHSILPLVLPALTTTLVPVMSVCAFSNPAIINPIYVPGQSFNFQVKPVGQAVTVQGSAGPPVGGTQVVIWKARRDD